MLSRNGLFFGLNCPVPFAAAAALCTRDGILALVEIRSWSLITRGDSTMLLDRYCC